MLTPPPEIMNPCETQKYFLQIRHDTGAVKLLKSRKFNNVIAKAELTVDELDTLLHILFHDKDMKFEVFINTKILKYQVTSFFRYLTQAFLAWNRKMK